MKRRFDIWLFAAITVIFAGCIDSDDECYVVGNGHVRVDLALTLSGSSGSKTRMADAVVQNASARDIEILQTIPLNGTTPEVLELGNVNYVSKTGAKFYYANCDISTGVDKFRVYAKAKDDDAVPSGVSSEAHNGCLKVLYDNASEGFPTISNETDISKISFKPVSILESTTAPAEAAALATYLTNIITNASVTALGNSYSWKSYNNNVLKKFFENFTNNGEIIPGSATNVREWVGQLKSALEGYGLFKEGSIEEMLRDKIIELCGVTTVKVGDNTYNINDLTYPRDVDLPDGAAVLKWNGTDTFEPQTETTTIAPIVNTITRYAYPPDLYYFVESTLKTSDEDVQFETLCNSSTNWAGVINDTRFTKTSVEETTRAVALENPVQYAVAQLKVTVRTTATAVPDGKTPTPQSITVGTENFPLTGVIVGGQRPVDDRFQQTGNEDANMKFVYDSQVKTNNDEYYCLKYNSTSPTSSTKGSNTLVFQSYDGENVTIIFEFENKSNKSFYGVNQQIIYPNTRFYMVGTITAPTYDNTNDYTRRVFTQDYVTTVDAALSSLAGAYNVLPNILSSNLEIGVETTPQWIAATPSTVILE